MKIKLQILIVFLIGIFFLSGCSGKSLDHSRDGLTEQQENAESELKININESTVDSDKEKIAQSSINEILNQKKDLKCNWRIERDEPVEEAEIDNEDEELSGGIEEGTVYLSGRKFLQIIKINQSSRENTVNLLSDGAFVYQWSSISSQGTKMEISEAKEIGVLDLKKAYNWVCEIWLVEDVYFNLPEGVEFIEI